MSVSTSLLVFSSLVAVTAAAFTDQDAAHLCPLWARDGECQSLFAADEMTLRFRDRHLSPDCDLSCQQCFLDNHTTSNVITDELLNSQVIDYMRHCVDLQVPETEDAWKPGDPDAMYRRILKEFPQYSPKILSRDPWAIQLDHFIATHEATRMINETRLEIEKGIAEDAFESANDEGGVCHSTQAWCDEEECLQKPEMQSVVHKIEDLVGLSWTYAEPLHFIEYTPGQKYGRHHDNIPEEMESMQGPRLFTLLFYLNDIEQGLGGETCFSDLNFCVQPKLGRAVIWANVLNDQPWAVENRTWHEASEIAHGYKNAATAWFHLRDYHHAKELDCFLAEDDIRDDLEIAHGLYPEDEEDEEYDDDDLIDDEEEYDEDEDFDEEFDEDYKDDGDYDNDWE